MTDTALLLAELRAAGVLLALEEGRLRVRAPRGVLSETRLVAIAAQRDTLLAELSPPSVPEPTPADPAPATAHPDLDETVANALSLSPWERAAWQAEIVAAVQYVKDGGEPDPNLAHDLAALRRIVPSGACLRCGEACPSDSQPWCIACTGI